MIKYGQRIKVATDGRLKKDSKDTDKQLTSYLISHYKNTMTKNDYARIRNNKIKPSM